MAGVHAVDADAMAYQPFSTPFDLASRDGQLVITPHSDRTLAKELQLKGVVWMGSQARGCPDGLGGGRSVEEHISFLQANSFNAVRLALSADYVTTDRLAAASCGEYAGVASGQVLRGILAKLRAAGIFVRACSASNPRQMSCALHEKRAACPCMCANEARAVCPCV